MKKIYAPTICVCFIIFCLLRFPDAMILASSEGLSLWLTKVFPSLFPFMVTCSVLMQIGAAQACGRLLSPIMRPLFHLPGIAAFPYFLGVLSGYPMGAKTTAVLYQKGQLTLDDAKHILVFSNNPGPLFLIGTVGSVFLGNPVWGYALLFCTFGGATVTGILYGIFKKKSSTYASKATAEIDTLSNTMPFLDALSFSIQNSMMTLLQIGGYLILFCVISRALSEIGLYGLLEAFLSRLPVSSAYLEGFFSGILEMTNGASLISQSGDSMRLKLSSICFLTSFGGLSILGQTLSILQEMPIKKSAYCLAKICNGGISTLFFLLFYTHFQKIAQKTVPAFHALAETAFTYSFSIWYFLFAAALVLLWRRRRAYR